MAMNILEIRKMKAQKKKQAPTFHVKEFEVDNKHKLQLNVNYGEFPGPWVVITFNDAAWGIGYLPEDRRS